MRCRKSEMFANHFTFFDFWKMAGSTPFALKLRIQINLMFFQNHRKNSDQPTFSSNEFLFANRDVNAVWAKTRFFLVFFSGKNLKTIVNFENDPLFSKITPFHKTSFEISDQQEKVYIISLSKKIDCISFYVCGNLFVLMSKTSEISLYIL